MKAVALLGLPAAVAVAACGGGEPAAPAGPMARSDDLWPGFSRAAVAALPDAAQIESACAEYSSRAIEEMERADPTMIVDPTFHDHPVRNPVCQWEAGSASTARCRYEKAEIFIAFPTPRQRAEALRAMRERDWEPFQARLVFVEGGSGGARWIAPRQCMPVRDPAAPSSGDT